MRFGRNLLASLTNSVWMALVGLAVVPLYLKYLGVEAYGLIGFFATTQALLSLLDLGFAAAINREVARCSASGKMCEARSLLHTLAIVYTGTALLIALLALTVAPYIANHWFQSSTMGAATLAQAIMLMGLVVSCRWPIGLYMGALMGMQRLVVSSTVNITMGTLGQFGAVVILANVSPTIEVFFLWQVAAALLHVTVIRWAAWKVMGRNGVEKFNFDGLKQIWRFSAGVSGVAVAAVFLTQLDKVLLIRMLSLEDFGRYALAGTVAAGLSVFVVPTFSTIYPRFSALVSAGGELELTTLYLQGTRLFCALVFPVALVMAIFSEDLVYVWTGNAPLAVSVAPIVALLVLGSAVNGLMHFPYALQLAYGMVRLSFILTSTLAVLLIPLIVWLSWSNGAEGGATAWLVMNGLYLLWGTWLTHRHLLKGQGAEWILNSVALPMGISVLVILVGRYGIDTWSDWDHSARLIASVMVGGASIAINLAMSPKIRHGLRSYFGDQGVTN